MQGSIVTFENGRVSWIYEGNLFSVVGEEIIVELKKEDNTIYLQFKDVKFKGLIEHKGVCFTGVCTIDLSEKFYFGEVVMFSINKATF